MSFIPKNPLTVPEIETPSSVPKTGTRGLFAGKDGWYDIDSSGKATKLGANGENSSSSEKEIFQMSMSTSGDVITSDKTYAEVKEAYDSGLIIVLNFEGTMVFPNINYDNENKTFYIEVCIGDCFSAFLFYESGVIEELIEREHVSKSELDVLQDTVDSIKNALDENTNELSGLDVNITAHSSDEEMHITYDERALWNTVSNKAEQSDLEDLRAETDGLYTQISNQEIFTVFTESTIVGNGLSVAATTYDDILDAYNSGKIIRFGMEDGFCVYPLVKFDRTENSLYFQYWKDNTWYAYRLRDDFFDASISMKQVACSRSMDADLYEPFIGEKSELLFEKSLVNAINVNYNNIDTLQSQMVEKSDAITILPSTETIATLEMVHNQEVRYDEVEHLEVTITVDSIDELPDDFISSVVFTSGNAPANFVYPDDPDNLVIIKMSGEDCIDGVFTPVANKRYTLIISYDGVYLTGIVGGVSI